MQIFFSRDKWLANDTSYLYYYSNISYLYYYYIKNDILFYTLYTIYKIKYLNNFST